jgi:hypothetical protein
LVEAGTAFVTVFFDCHKTAARIDPGERRAAIHVVRNPDKLGCFDLQSS